MRGRAIAGVGAIAVAAGAHADCGEHLPRDARFELASADAALVFAPRGTAIEVGRPFGVDVAVCAPDASTPPILLRVDAEMPLHRHGMNYRPVLRALGDGPLRDDGLMFHMPGRWRFSFDLQAPEGRTLRLTQEFELE